MNEHHIFVLALARSGSTLLAYVLDSHSAIHVEHEDSGRPHETTPDKEARNLMEKIQGGFAEYLNDLLVKGNGKQFLVSSRYYARRHVKLITEALGQQVKFIVLTRRHMWRIFRDADGQAHVVPFRQLLEFAACRRMVIAKYTHVEISYEEMVREPQRTFSRLCEFIGVKFEPAMLDYSKLEHPHLANRGNEKTRRFARIVDRTEAELGSGATLIRQAAERIGLRRGG